MKTWKVLIVDDEKNIRLTLKKALEKLELEIETAVSGEEALELLTKGGLALVLLDLRLPGMDGMEVLKRMREMNYMTKVIIITAHGTVENAVEAMKLGAVDFIQKPFIAEEIRMLVSNALQRQKGFLQTTGQATGSISAFSAGASEAAPSYDDSIQQTKAAIEAMDFARARLWAEKAVAMETARPEAYNLLGVLMELTHDFLQAQKYYRAALSIDPTYRPAQANLRRATKIDSAGGLDLGNGQEEGKKKIRSFLGTIKGRKDEK